MSVTDLCSYCGGDCGMSGCPQCHGCENTGEQPCPACEPPAWRCPDCGRADCTGINCYWPDDEYDDDEQ